MARAMWIAAGFALACGAASGNAFGARDARSEDYFRRRALLRRQLQGQGRPPRTIRKFTAAHRTLPSARLRVTDSRAIAA